MLILDHSTGLVIQSNLGKMSSSASYDTQKTGKHKGQNPTEEHKGYQQAFNHFNDRLFDGELPPCLITLQRNSHTRGYYSGKRFASQQGDEIALDPGTFDGYNDKDILSITMGSGLD